MIEQAKNGDVQAAKVLIDKVIPSLKPQTEVVKVANSESLTETGKEIIEQTLSGVIPPDTGGGLVTMLSNQGKLVELDTLLQRMADIEKLLVTMQAAKNENKR